MRRFAAPYRALDAGTASGDKVAALLRRRAPAGAGGASMQQRPGRETLPKKLPAEAPAVVAAISRRQPAAPGGLQLLPIAQACPGLDDEEFKAVDRVVRATTLEKFGPLRSLRPTLVFEIAFEGLNASPRCKSGIAVRFPRMLRLRPDKPLHGADTLDSLRALLALAD